MLLTEIKRLPPKPKREYFPRIHPGDMPERFQKVGSGIGAGILPSEVYVDKIHPNRILKVVRIRNLQDPYYRYVLMVQQHQNNPFFPRIYGVKVYEHNDTIEYGQNGVGDQYILHVFMEKLHPVSELDEEVARQILWSVGIPYKGEMKDDYSLRTKMGKDEYRKLMKQHTQHPKLKEALRLLEPMFKKFGNDVHIDNLMFRLTGVGPQVVLVDPLYPDLGELSDAGFDDWNY